MADSITERGEFDSFSLFKSQGQILTGRSPKNFMYGDEEATGGFFCATTICLFAGITTPPPCVFCRVPGANSGVVAMKAP